MSGMVASAEVFPRERQEQVLDSARRARASGPTMRDELRQVEAKLMSCTEGSAAVAPPAAETTRGEAEVRRVCRHLIEAGGKRLRPLLLLLAARSGQQASAHTIVSAAAVELLHLATLYHDDVVDQAATRRGVVSVNARWGNQTAAFAGGFLFARAAELFAEAGDEANRMAAAAVAELWHGQMAELEGVYNLDLDAPRFLEVVGQKTGSLYELPCRLGAHLSQAPPALCAALAEYGRSLGVAFQLVDDVLDIAADATTLGKEPGSDLREGVYTLPVIYTLRQTNPDSQRLRTLLLSAEFDEAEVASVRHLLLENGSLRRSLDTAREFMERAERAVAELPDDATRDALTELARSVLRRADQWKTA